MEEEGWGRSGFDVWANMYNYTMYSLCFGSHIPIHISTKILDWVVLMNDEDHSLVTMIVYMLKVCEEKIMDMSNGNDRFQYISKGRFIIECFENQAFFDELVQKHLTV